MITPSIFKVERQLSHTENQTVIILDAEQKLTVQNILFLFLLDLNKTNIIFHFLKKEYQ